MAKEREKKRASQHQTTRTQLGQFEVLGRRNHLEEGVRVEFGFGNHLWFVEFGEIGWNVLEERLRQVCAAEVGNAAKQKKETNGKRSKLLGKGPFLRIKASERARGAQHEIDAIFNFDETRAVVGRKHPLDAINGRFDDDELSRVVDSVIFTLFFGQLLDDRILRFVCCTAKKENETKPVL